MGCCVCRPKEEVTEDPDVIMYTKVKGTALFHSWGSIMLSGACNGLIYVKDGKLCYEATMGSRMCCKCLKRSWDLSLVKQITVVHNETVMVPGRRMVHFISLNPGLKISIQYGGGAVHTLVTSMPDAVNFSAQLGQHINQHYQ